MRAQGSGRSSEGKRSGGLEQQVQEALVDRVRSNGTDTGEVICTIAGLSEEIHISVTTVRKAVRGLVDRGLVRVVRNRGVVLTAEPGELTGALAPSPAGGTFHMFLGRDFLPARRVDMAQMVAGIEGRLTSRRARLEIVTLPDSPYVQADFVLERLSQGSSGCFLCPLALHTQHVLDACEAMELPVVFMEPFCAEMHTLGAKAVLMKMHEPRAIPMIVGRIAELGHKRAALVGFAYLLGAVVGIYLDEAAKSGLEVTNELLIPFGRVDVEEADLFGRHVADRVLAVKERPTAVVVIEHCIGAMTAAVIREFLSRGVRVGQEISVVSSEVGLLASIPEGPSPAGVKPLRYETGRSAAETMMALADGTLSGPGEIDIQDVWVDGDSLGPAPKGDVKKRARLSSPPRKGGRL